ncbi:MAG: condensation domain-containing protein [Gammaproteobacteria bacterium]
MHYADYAEWQRDWLTPERLEGQLTYWREKLAEVPPLLELPLDKPRPATQTTEGASLSFSFDPAFVPRLRAFCAEQGVTPFMFTLTAWKLLLAKYSGQHDIVVGVPSLGRDTQELENIIGFFIHSFVLRTQLGDKPSVKSALQRVRQTVLDAFSHGDVPVDMLVEHLVIRRNPAYSPLVQVAFQLLDQASMQQDALPGGNFGDVAIEPVGESGGTAKFDITLNLSLADATSWLVRWNTTPRCLWKPPCSG